MNRGPVYPTSWTCFRSVNLNDWLRVICRSESIYDVSKSKSPQIHSWPWIRDIFWTWSISFLRLNCWIYIFICLYKTILVVGEKNIMLDKNLGHVSKRKMPDDPTNPTPSAPWPILYSTRKLTIYLMPCLIKPNRIWIWNPDPETMWLYTNRNTESKFGCMLTRSKSGPFFTTMSQFTILLKLILSKCRIWFSNSI